MLTRPALVLPLQHLEGVLLPAELDYLRARLKGGIPPIAALQVRGGLQDAVCRAERLRLAPPAHLLEACTPAGARAPPVQAPARSPRAAARGASTVAARAPSVAACRHVVPAVPRRSCRACWTRPSWQRWSGSSWSSCSTRSTPLLVGGRRHRLACRRRVCLGNAPCNIRAGSKGRPRPAVATAARGEARPAAFCGQR